MQIHGDAWLSDVMGHSVFRVEINTGSRNDDPHALEKPSTREGPSFYYTKVPVEQVDLVRRLAANGFYTVDVNVTFGCEARRWTPAQRSKSVVVRDVQPADAEQVLDIASTAFRYSRFHLDPAIGTATANRIKREWIANYLDGRRGLRLSVAADGDDVAGFVAVLGAERDGRRIRVIDLIAVSPRHQRRGIGRELVAHFVDQFGPEADALEVGTQIANVPSMQLYERCGFSIARSAYVMHKHVPDGQIAS